MIKYYFIAFMTFSTIHMVGQIEGPEKHLTPEFHKGRREAFRTMMPANSVAFVFAYSERNFSNDVDYYYQPNPNLFYLSGYKEPNSVLIIYKDIQGTGPDAHNEVLYVQERNLFKEKWDGKRMGVEGAMSKLGFTKVFECKDFIKHSFDLSKFAMVLYDDIPEDIVNKGTGYDLYAMIDKFIKLSTQDKSDADKKKWYKFISSNLSYDRIQFL